MYRFSVLRWWSILTWNLCSGLRSFVFQCTRWKIYGFCVWAANDFVYEGGVFFLFECRYRSWLGFGVGFGADLVLRSVWIEKAEVFLLTKNNLILMCASESTESECRVFRYCVRVWNWSSFVVEISNCCWFHNGHRNWLARVLGSK